MDLNAPEFYRKYRPTKLEDLVGQKSVVDVLQTMAKRNEIPHGLLLVGSTGSGKTTTARIIQSMLKCADRDFFEIDPGRDRGIDAIRAIGQQMNLSPMGGTCRIYVFDECQVLQSLTQDALLKLVEDAPPHVYCIFCTTNPSKIKKTLQGRCVRLEFRPLSTVEAKSLIYKICKKEDLLISDSVVKAIISRAEGSPRLLLNLLYTISGVEKEKDQLLALEVSESIESQVFELGRILMGKNPKWSEIVQTINEIALEPEEIRWKMLAYAKGVFVRSPHPKAYAIVNAFRYNFYETGPAGLYAACFEVVNQ